MISEGVDQEIQLEYLDALEDNLYRIKKVMKKRRDNQTVKKVVQRTGLPNDLAENIGDYVRDAAGTKKKRRRTRKLSRYRSKKIQETHPQYPPETFYRALLEAHSNVF